MELTNQEISVEICNRLGIKISGKTSGQVVVSCFNPSHFDKNPSCSVSLDKGVFHCWSCGYSGSLKNLYYQTFHRSIYKDLGVQRQFSFNNTTPIVEEDFNSIPEIDFKFTGNFFPMDSTDLSKAWMKRRGFNIKLMNDLGIRYLKYGRTIKKSDPSNKTEWRSYSDMAMIPIYENGQLICFEARQLRTEEEWRKYLQSKEIDDSEKTYKKVLYPKNSSTKTLFRLNYLDREKPLYLVEGLMDLISLKTNSIFENSTTTFGRSIKERQFYFLNQFKKIIIIPNLDVPGLSAIQQFKDKNMKNVFILCLPFNNGLKDVNDILQLKCPRFTSLQDLTDMKWLDSEIHINEFDIQRNIDRLS